MYIVSSFYLATSFPTETLLSLPLLVSSESVLLEFDGTPNAAMFANLAVRGTGSWTTTHHQDGLISRHFSEQESPSIETHQNSAIPQIPCSHNLNYSRTIDPCRPPAARTAALRAPTGATSTGTPAFYSRRHSTHPFLTSSRSSTQPQHRGR